MGQANRLNLVVEQRGTTDPITGKTTNPNGVKGVRRVDMMEVYYKRGWISDRGYTAGEKLRDKWEATERSPGWSDNDRVQSSPKPDQAVAMRIDRLSQLVRITRLMPPQHKSLIEAVAIRQRSINAAVVDGARPYVGRGHKIGQSELMVAFDALADAIGC
ncbi:hypothetical protein AN189_17580 [Loktanella sp. 3ANDIMAR09]|nr:hypothetical protein AN189_17580 [Loktanella sp. 3ANDIMAR09]